MTHKFIPPHLRKYIVNQNYDNYSYIDHSVWRYIMRISKAFFEKNAHHSYVKGLEKTGITIDKIPRVDEMDKKLSEFGWGAVCVRGFIPPSAFMELQSRGILAIAADMRTIEHLTYTPAPDIVHEAAGHAPIISDPSYAEYLHNYGEVASKAISSKDDYNLYLAIRKLSDVKESVSSTSSEIKEAELNLDNAIENFSYVSEAAYLARMNWWTVEYGLVGDINNPKIYGAGLLSSVSESQNCLSENVKKIPFSIECINTTYDITEPQPQLFVVPDFNELSKVLDEMAETMAFKRGGVYGLQKAKESRTVCTAEYDSKIQVSGILHDYIVDENNNPIYIQYTGPTQLSRYGNELRGHGGDYHLDGFSSPVGNIKNLDKPICDFNDDDILKINLKVNENIKVEFQSSLIVSGKVKNILEDNGRILIVSFDNCYVKFKDTILFKPEWGLFDMACGGSIVSVYGGPADYEKYNKFFPDYNSNNIKISSKPSISKSHANLNELYKSVRKIRENKYKADLEKLEKIYLKLISEFPNDWLLIMELLELDSSSGWSKDAFRKLKYMAKKNSEIAIVVERGLALI